MTFPVILHFQYPLLPLWFLPLCAFPIAKYCTIFHISASFHLFGWPTSCSFSQCSIDFLPPHSQNLSPALPSPLLERCPSYDGVRFERVNLLLNSSPTDELGRWCPETWWEPDAIKSKAGSKFPQCLAIRAPQISATICN